MVAYIRRLAVVQRRWIDEDDFRLGTALCQAVPGATAMQAAAYVGLRARGLGGAVSAYVGFGLPAFALMLVMSLAYERAVSVQAVTAALTGFARSSSRSSSTSRGQSDVRRFTPLGVRCSRRPRRCSSSWVAIRS
jgi:chromate transport protein ChrA